MKIMKKVSCLKKGHREKEVSGYCANRKCFILLTERGQRDGFLRGGLEDKGIMLDDRHAIWGSNVYAAEAILSISKANPHDEGY